MNMHGRHVGEVLKKYRKEITMDFELVKRNEDAG